MKPLSQLVRPNILALQPYSTARDLSLIHI